MRGDPGGWSTEHHCSVCRKDKTVKVGDYVSFDNNRPNDGEPLVAWRCACGFTKWVLLSTIPPLLQHIVCELPKSVAIV